MTDFYDLIDTDDLSDDEEERLRRTHDLLLRVGPPPDLPAGLLKPPTESREAEAVETEVETNVVSLHARRAPLRVRVALVAAAAIAAAAFGGYLFGHSNSSGAFASARSVPMHAVAGVGTQAVGLVKVGHIDSNGNWPLQMKVAGLPKQPAGDYYELWLTRDGKPYASCGTFRVQGNTTTVRFSVPYTLRNYGGWVVTKVEPGTDEPGQTLMTT